MGQESVGLVLAKAKILISVAFDIPNYLMVTLLDAFDFPEHKSSTLGTSIAVFSEHRYKEIKLAHIITTTFFK
jgi:hypothetical protein